MRRPKAERMYSVRFFVRGAGDFPFDMLRYDSCFPVYENEARSMAEKHELRTVELEQRRMVGSPTGPTVGRWESFGWRASLSREELEREPRRR